MARSPFFDQVSGGVDPTEWGLNPQGLPPDNEYGRNDPMAKSLFDEQVQALVNAIMKNKANLDLTNPDTIRQEMERRGVNPFRY